MWANQVIETGGSPALEIEHHASVILRVATEIVGAARFHLGFIVFPVLMAGIASSSPSQKMLAHDLLSSFEHRSEGVGRNISTARHLLHIVYQRQTDSYMARGHALDVSWMSIMVEQGLQVVNFDI
jgi:hypothetical protein